MARARFTPLRIALIAGAVVSVLRIAACQPPHTPSPLDLLDLRALDYRLRLRSPGPVAPEVVIVAIDDASLKLLGRWPWPRARIADLVDTIAAGDPAVIGIDILQSEPTAECSLSAVEVVLDDACRGALRAALTGAQRDDERLAEAVRASGRTVLGYFLDLDPRGPAGGTLPSGAPPIAEGKEIVDRLPRAASATQNLPALAQAARGVGYFNVSTDADGILRRVPLAIRFEGRDALPLSLAMLRVYWPQRSLTIRSDRSAFGVDSVRLGGLSVPVEEDGTLLLNYRGKGGSFREFSAYDVLAGRVPPQAFSGKIVLIGVTAVAVADVRATPLGPMYPGVEIHATILDNILREDFIRRPRWLGPAGAGVADVAVTLGLVTLLGLALKRVRGVAAAVVALTVLGAYLAGSQLLFTGTGIVLSTVYPGLAIGFTYVGIGVHHYVVVEREKRNTRRMLDLYLSPALARHVSDHPEQLRLGGEKRPRTVLFSDIVNFTPLAERMEPERLVELLNQYLHEMTEIVFAHGGMLDKYIGDGLMAVWGAPLPQADHAACACGAALAMVGRLPALNAHAAQRGWPPVRIRIGVHSGPMVFGNIGSTGHLSLTVMGDNVNLGARLEGLNKFYGSAIIASQATVEAAGEAVVARELDLVRVKGRAQAVRIFELLGPAAEAARWAALREHFGAGLTAYRAREWDGAVAAFERALSVCADDGPSALFLRRCQEHRKTPPPPGWAAITGFGEA